MSGKSFPGAAIWLAVIADDRAADAGSVEPLPNLDCLIRQGDSLFDPIGSAVPARASAAPTAELAGVRKRIVVASGAAKRAALRELIHLEARIAEMTLAEADASAQTSIAECLEAARHTGRRFPSGQPHDEAAEHACEYGPENRIHVDDRKIDNLFLVMGGEVSEVMDDVFGRSGCVFCYFARWR